MPEAISELEDAVDQTAGTDRWVTGGPQTLEAMRTAGIEPHSQQAAEVLVYAVKEGRAEAVRRLLAAGAPVRTQNAKGGYRSLLTTASFIRDPGSQLEVFKELLESAEVLSDKDDLQGALGRVSGDGNVEVARTLIAAGADPTQRFPDTYQFEGKPDQTYLMRAASSGIWEMLEDALNRPHDIHALDSQGRSALGHVVWSAPPLEDIFPLIDRLLAAGADRAELTRTLADACNSPQWRDGLFKRGANPAVCNSRK
jgi:ankyrin repeat protein